MKGSNKKVTYETIYYKSVPTCAHGDWRRPSEAATVYRRPSVCDCKEIWFEKRAVGLVLSWPPKKGHE